QHGNHCEAAPDAEQAGEESDQRAEQEKDRYEREVHAPAGRSARRVIFSHSAAVTGVIDKRLPRRNVTMSSSPCVSRSSASGISRVLRTSFTSTCSQRGSSRVDFGS